MTDTLTTKKYVCCGVSGHAARGDSGRTTLIASYRESNIRQVSFNLPYVDFNTSTPRGIPNPTANQSSSDIFNKKYVHAPKFFLDSRNKKGC